MVFEKFDVINKFLHADIANAVISDYKKCKEDASFEDNFLVTEGVVRRRIELESKLAGGEIEAHDFHIDVQIMLKGDEIIEVFDRSLLHPKSVNETTDFTLFNAGDAGMPKSSIYMQKDFALILFPHDAHKTQIAANMKEGKFLKVVYKIKKSKI
jgi:beta-galactosidase beta subunit